MNSKIKIFLNLLNIIFIYRLESQTCPSNQGPIDINFPLKEKVFDLIFDLENEFTIK